MTIPGKGAIGQPIVTVSVAVTHTDEFAPHIPSG